MLLSMSIQPGGKIYYLDTNDGSVGEAEVSYAKVVEMATGTEIQYRRADDVLDLFICTEREICNRIPRDGVLYFSNVHIRDAYKEKMKK